MKEGMMAELRHVKQYFRIHDRLTVKALDDVSFGIRKGEVLGLVGESGCGKSTVARVISGIYQPTEGEVLFDGKPVSGKTASKEQIRRRQQELQLIFQDSAAALNPRMTVEELILEPWYLRGNHGKSPEMEQRLENLLKETGLSSDFRKQRPDQLSGGQRQRVAIARSLLPDLKCIVADEPVASLDISIQAQILTLLAQLQREKGFSLLLIAHDLSVVRWISDRVGVMLQGKLVELAKTEELFNNPLHPYTKALLSAMPIPDPVLERKKKILYYDTRQPLGNTMMECVPGHFVCK